MLVEIRNDKTFTRRTVVDEREAIRIARDLVKRWKKPFVVYRVRKHDNKKKFVAKIKP